MDEARKIYADEASAYVMDRRAPYTKELLFDVPQGGKEDLDKSIIAAPMAKQMAEKMEDVLNRPIGQ
ncbi:MAG: hypothetical protein KY429_10310 [Actinobacteria bacterium]|nr:hypothetical protein [Actinomycetota bacterium]